MTAVAVSEERLVELLGAIAACDGSVRLAKRRLADHGTEATEKELKLVLADHSGMYMAITNERCGAQEEAIAQEYRELVKLSQRATKTFLDELNDQLETGTLEYDMKRQMPQIIQALAKVQQTGTDKLLSLTGRPADGGGADPMAAAQLLVSLGVITPRDRPQVDAEATAAEA